MTLTFRGPTPTLPLSLVGCGCAEGQTSRQFVTGKLMNLPADVQRILSRNEFPKPRPWCDE